MGMPSYLIRMLFEKEKKKGYPNNKTQRRKGRESKEGDGSRCQVKSQVYSLQI